VVQKIVIGTLSTLNTIISPLDPNAGSVSNFELQASPSVVPSCTYQRETIKSSLSMSIETPADSYLATRISGRICAKKGLINLSYLIHLPTELLDDDLLERIPNGQPYIVHGLPSAKNPARKTTVKISRQSAINEIIPITIDWVPEATLQPEHPRLTIWIASKKSGPDRWRRIQFSTSPNVAPGGAPDGASDGASGAASGNDEAQLALIGDQVPMPEKAKSLAR
jgi:hypothetical protein